jgi:hypothetical protein
MTTVSIWNQEICDETSANVGTGICRVSCDQLLEDLLFLIFYLNATLFDGISIAS